MTKVRMHSGIDAYTDLSVAEVRQYLQKAVSTGSFDGYTAEDKSVGIIISVQAVEFIYK